MPQYFLAIESSCDETAAAVFTDGREILSNVVASQHELHARFGGVVPEIAARAHLRNILPVIDEALRVANVTLDDLCAVAVNHRPGLVGALLVGVTAAKTLAMLLDIPLIGVNHIAGHVYACRLAAGRDIFPCVGFVVSGGHTVLFDCPDPLTLTMIGNTRDDAAGEAFDKVAAILGLGFPGGPALEREAAAGNPKAFAFPRSFIHEPKLEFSFSGLKTSVLYTVQGQDAPRGAPVVAPPPGRFRADIAASFQQAVVDVLVRKARQALRNTNYGRLAVGGGVTANRTFRSALQAMADAEGAELFVPPLNLCTDNAALAALAVEKWLRGDFASLDLDAYPSFQ